MFTYLDYTPAGIPDFLIEKGTEFIKVLAERNGWTDDVGNSEAGTLMLVRGAAAYAIVKVLLPVRAAFSLALMPWFASWVVIPVTRVFSRRSSAKAKVSAKEEASSSTHSQTVEQKLVPTPPADPKGQVWNQDLPSEAPTFQKKGSADPNRPSL